MGMLKQFRGYLKNKKLQKSMEILKVGGIMELAFATRPKLVRFSYDAKDNLFEVDMKSGKTAIYKCIKYEKAWNVDWGWYYLKFERYS